MKCKVIYLTLTSASHSYYLQPISCLLKAVRDYCCSLLAIVLSLEETTWGMFPYEGVLQVMDVHFSRTQNKGLCEC